MSVTICWFFWFGLKFMVRQVKACKKKVKLVIGIEFCQRAGALYYCSWSSCLCFGCVVMLIFAQATACACSFALVQLLFVNNKPTKV